MIAQIVRFRSRMSDQQVLQTYEARAPRYRSLPGLIEKYYLHFADTGEHGAVYLWKSVDAMNAFRESKLAHSISEAYQVEAAPVVHTGTVVMTLHSSF